MHKVTKCCAGIVTYNPEIERLRIVIKQIVNQVDEIIIVDNNSQNQKEIEALSVDYTAVVVVSNSDNEGIARALNTIFEIADQRGFEWALTLDHDTVCPDDIIEQLSVHCNRKNIGIVCPAVDYENLDINDLKYNSSLSYPYACMTSGSLTNIVAWKKVGGFREDYFIDFVDNEFCMKLGLSGFIIVRVNECVMHHQLGNACEKKVLGVFKKKVSVHSPWRFYYMTRNNLLFIREYRSHINVIKEYLKLCGILISGLLYADDKVNTFFYIKKGIIDARKRKTGKLLL